MAEARKRRLLVDARWVRRRITGVGNAILRQLQGLDLLLAEDAAVAAHWEVFVLRLPESSSPDPWSDFHHLHQIHSSADPETHPGGDWFLRSTLPRLAERMGIDVLFSPAYFAPTGGCRAARVVMFHDDLIWSQPSSYPLKFRAFMNLAMRGAARACDRIIFPSADACQLVVRRLGIPAARAGVVPHGLDRATFRKAPLAGREPFALCIASAELRKNQEVLVGALAQLPPAVRLVFVGCDPEAATRSRWLGAAAGRLEIIPRASPAEVAALLTRAAVMVHPSRGEGFGFPVLEAMACGTPMVLSDIPVLHEVAGGAALYVGPDDVAGWSRAIAESVAAGDAVQSRVAIGDSRAGDFSLQACGRALLRECTMALR